MIIPSKYRAELCCSKDKSRYILNALYLRGSMLYATNGCAAVQIPVELEPGDVDGFIPMDALIEARRTHGRRQIKKGDFDFHISAKEATLGFDTKFGAVEMKRDPDLKAATFPDMKKVLAPKAARKNFVTSLNVNMLHAVATALGSTSVTISFDNENTAIMVEALGPTGGAAHGILMPVRAS